MIRLVIDSNNCKFACTSSANVHSMQTHSHERINVRFNARAKKKRFRTALVLLMSHVGSIDLFTRD